MTRDKDPAPLTKPPALRREDRLKAALKANMARRKAQAKLRGDRAAEAGKGQDDG